MTRAIRRIAGLLTAASLAYVGLSAPRAEAYDISVSASIVASKCVTGIKWQGKSKSAKGLWPGYIPTQPNGTLKVCVHKLKLKDKDKKADYYATEVVTTVTLSKSHKAAVKKGASEYFGSSPFTLVTSSSKSAISSVYGGTPSIRRTAGSVNVSAGFGLGPFSISSSSKLNVYTAVARSTLAKGQAAWRGDDISNLKTLSVIYAQKVSTKGSSKAPKMVVSLAVPYYVYHWSRHLTRVHGYSYYAYSPDRTLVKVDPVTIIL